MSLGSTPSACSTRPPQHSHLTNLQQAWWGETRLQDWRSGSENVGHGTKLPEAKYRPRAPK